MPSTPLAPAEEAYYTAQSSFSDPGPYASRYAGLPADPGELARVVRGLLLHREECALFSHSPDQARLHHDAEARYVDEQLRLLLERDPSALTTPRRLEHRLLGICRDFALLLCSFLRRAGVPARTRCGFATYFRTEPGQELTHVDHMVTEYWDARRGWLLADAELLDGRVRQVHDIDFDPLDVPRDRFLVAGEAWQAIREGRAEPRSFGVPIPEQPLQGAWFVAGNLRLDLAALNKRETLLWDIWGISPGKDEELTEEHLLLFDEVARATTGALEQEALRALFRHPGLALPRTVHTLPRYLLEGPVELR